ncbi:glycine--tRNA ligase subunit beta [Natranaerofaba carboxydovora]|uniref:glycine--tRNA ligase subunit beta n=1 Tax=Natranaerofaba carboxydovora TaxID=2742683 RepID=UPI001F138B56|nr:glycine--tRNA ligase subunit beta [Natranaerofaba carboxydovora]UMZ73093.1 Glycine--tRNA ligase beta subunit [Natranaerofaba carboxydovora]
MSSTKNNLLFEIGTEELPARLMQGVLNQMKNNAKIKLKDNRLKFDDIKVMGTPRRLALIVDGMEETQEDLEEYVKGPSVDIAYDENGEPTKAAHGFAKSSGVDVSELEVKDVKGKQYVYAVSKTEGKTAKELLPSILEDIIVSFDFPGKMFWENKSEKFIRPIRWLVAIYKDEVLPVKFGSVKADRFTRGHRSLSSGDIEVKTPEEYPKVMNDAFIMVDHEERKKEIKKQIDEIADSVNAKANFSEELLNEVNFLVEWPTALLCEFSEKFLELPDKALTTFMEKHQRYFPVKNDKGELLPYFITIKNGDNSHIDTVKKGNEKVIKARLSDARFFYEEDKKTTLEEKLEKLKSIVYREELGSVYQKTERMDEIARTLLDILEIGEPVRSHTLRATLLSKADLVTQMVFEFSNLQGYMGMEYAKIDGEEEEVCQGIYEHYLPKHAGDELPQTIVGTIVSIADKVDNIASSFAIGQQPTGTQDPYALRRQALGMIYIILEAELHVSLRKIFRKALSLIPDDSFVAPSTEVLEDIMNFMESRIKTVFTDYNLEGDVINSVLASEGADVYLAYSRIKDLQEEKGTERLEEIMTAYNRVKNLAHKANGSDIYLELLKSDQERVLFHRYEDAKEKVEELLEEGDNKSALEELTKLREPIDDFFDHVMVMVEDHHLKDNRLNLLHHINELFHKVADFSKLR